MFRSPTKWIAATNGQIFRQVKRCFRLRRTKQRDLFGAIARNQRGFLADFQNLLVAEFFFGEAGGEIGFNLSFRAKSRNL